MYNLMWNVELQGLFTVFILQTASAYVLFYHRRTEGRPIRRNIMDRSLSQSFADEHKKLQEKYSTLVEEGEGEGDKNRDDEQEKTEEEKMDEGNGSSNRSRNEVHVISKNANSDIHECRDKRYIMPAWSFDAVKYE